MIEAVLFDLDGVITDTAFFHYKAWKKLANNLGGDIDEKFNEELKGVDRVESLNRILKHINVELEEEKREESMKWKNDYYLTLLDELSKKDILPGIEEFIDDLRSRDIKISIASASKNAPLILKKIGLISKVDYIANPSDVQKGKPAPDIFLLAADLAGAKIENCIGIEDSQAGLDALNHANIMSISIGEGLIDSTIPIQSTEELKFKLLLPYM